MREIVLTLYDAISAEIQKAEDYYREMGELMLVKFCLSNIVAKLGSNERTKELSILIAWLLDRTE